MVVVDASTIVKLWGGCGAIALEAKKWPAFSRTDGVTGFGP